MRELKFRALCDVDLAEGDHIEKMVYFNKIECDNGLWFEAPDKVYHINEYLSPIEQFTGLTDKNGKEIYEGDICELRYVKETKFNTVTGVVKWYEVHTHFSLDAIGGPYSLNMGGSLVDGIYVIGNVHQNPELLTN